jgi:hypothetical protein
MMFSLCGPHSGCGRRLNTITPKLLPTMEVLAKKNECDPLKTWKEGVTPKLGKAFYGILSVQM